MPRGFTPNPNDGQHAVMTALGFQLADEVHDAEDCLWHGHGLSLMLKASEAVTALYVVTRITIIARDQGREHVRREARDLFGIR